MKISPLTSGVNVDLVSEILESDSPSSGVDVVTGAVFTRCTYTQISHAYIQRENTTLSTTTLDAGNRDNACNFRHQLDFDTDDRWLRPHCLPSL
jgi:hypothetical protein